MIQNCVVFGAGEWGRGVLPKLRLQFEALAFCDNNEALWGTRIDGVPVVPPHELKAICGEETGIFICNQLHWKQIAEQLDRIGLRYIYCERGLCYAFEDGVQVPLSFGSPEPYQKESREDFSVLYVQDKPCTRTNKIAHVMKKLGAKTYSAYTTAFSDAGEASYLAEYGFWTYRELLDFVRKSEFDVIHCSNEPDELVNLLLHSGKKIIHDTHDMTSLRNRNIAGQWLLEYLANTQADGCMYATEEVRNIAIQKHAGKQEQTFSVGNYPLNSFQGKTKHRKLSNGDGKLHCVYEGGMNTARSSEISYRFFEDIFLAIAKAGIHVHFYSNAPAQYCMEVETLHERLHYEGNYSGIALISELTKYDVGLMMFEQNRSSAIHLNATSTNKLYEYLSAGLPIVSNVRRYIDEIEALGCGGALDLDGDIAGQLRAISAIKIADDFVQTHGLTMDANAERILSFYKRIAYG